MLLVYYTFDEIFRIKKEFSEHKAGPVIVQTSTFDQQIHKANFTYIQLSNPKQTEIDLAPNLAPNVEKTEEDENLAVAKIYLQQYCQNIDLELEFNHCLTKVLEKPAQFSALVDYNNVDKFNSTATTLINYLQGLTLLTNEQQMGITQMLTEYASSKGNAFLGSYYKYLLLITDPYILHVDKDKVASFAEKPFPEQTKNYLKQVFKKENIDEYIANRAISINTRYFLYIANEIIEKIKIDEDYLKQQGKPADNNFTVFAANLLHLLRVYIDNDIPSDYLSYEDVEAYLSGKVELISYMQLAYVSTLVSMNEFSSDFLRLILQIYPECQDFDSLYQKVSGIIESFDALQISLDEVDEVSQEVPPGENDVELHKN
ncbi:hypothetical protein [Psittacicella hinzii]|uniref:hypothetical protein n=1 Tax=Psittacicella hinzii TaxID=2028575 RepID=UPI0036D434D6